MTLIAFSTACASDNITARRVVCPPFPVPSKHVTEAIKPVRKADPQVEVWWTDLGQYVTDCETRAGR